MKELFLLLFIIIGLSAYSQQVTGQLEAGIIPKAGWSQTTPLYDHYYEGYENVIYIQLAIYLELMKRDTGVRIGGDVITYMYDTPAYLYHYPVYSSYTLMLELVWKRMSLGFEHNCSHETLGNSYIGSILNFQSSFDKFYFRIKF